jgi:hypothetical protein
VHDAAQRKDAQNSLTNGDMPCPGRCILSWGNGNSLVPPISRTGSDSLCRSCSQVSAVRGSRSHAQSSVGSIKSADILPCRRLRLDRVHG